MANVEGLHTVGAKVWALIEGARDGINLADAAALQDLIVAVLAVKDDLDTKPELIPAGLNIASGLTDAIAGSLRTE